MLSQRIIFLIAACLLADARSSRAAEEIDFNRDVRPILSDKCFQCHGPDEAHREADLRLDQPPRPGNKSVITPGNSQDSELIRRIKSGDADEHMPPAKSGKKLSNAEISILQRWIEQGAKWATHWAYVAPVRHETSSVGDATWSSHWIDRFMQARWERERAQAPAEADRITLIRRLSFDLRGLPPSLEEVDAFVRDDDSRAWEKLIDRFLASDAFGERMAVYWLDLVRYADTVGYHGDQEHHISPFRDWVIDAFINNMPFDRFTREQLAGDLLPDAGTDQKIASGYNRLLQTSHEGGVQAKEYLAMYAADRVRNFSAVWLGGTLGCAQCHNHKFDPYTAKDFYSLAAFFADLDEDRHLRKGSDTTPTPREPQVKVLTQRERARAAELDRRIEHLKSRISDLKSQNAKSAADAKAAMLTEQLAAAEKQRDLIDKNARLTMISAAIGPREMRLLPRGNWMDDSGPIVQPAVPEFLGKLQIGERRATRLDLAKWLTDSKNGIGLFTARVFVNRAWSLLFGNGLCRSLEDFGGQGEAPDHPELLDRLAWEFVESGWNVKHIVKQIALSRTYRLASAPDSAVADRLFIHQSRFRLPAEMIRDNALAISGLLVHEVGGPSVRPYQPPGYYKYLNFPKRDYAADKDQRQWRRGLYVHWQRQYLHPMLKAFDAPRREECAAQRPRSNTPLAALTLLNDPTFLEAARAFAAKVVADGGDSDDSRLNFAFLRATSREPDEIERGVLRELLTESRQQFAQNEAAAKGLLSIGQSPLPANISPTELAAWTVVGRAILNLGEVVTRN